MKFKTVIAKEAKHILCELFDSVVIYGCMLVGSWYTGEWVRQWVVT